MFIFPNGMFESFFSPARSPKQRKRSKEDRYFLRNLSYGYAWEEFDEAAFQKMWIFQIFNTPEPETPKVLIKFNDLMMECLAYMPESGFPCLVELEKKIGFLISVKKLKKFMEENSEVIEKLVATKISRDAIEQASKRLYKLLYYSIIGEKSKNIEDRRWESQPETAPEAQVMESEFEIKNVSKVRIPISRIFSGIVKSIGFHKKEKNIEVSYIKSEAKEIGEYFKTFFFTSAF